MPMVHREAELRILERGLANAAAQREEWSWSRVTPGSAKPAFCESLGRTCGASGFCCGVCVFAASKRAGPGIGLATYLPRLMREAKGGPDCRGINAKAGSC